jgi:hypothetical protein
MADKYLVVYKGLNLVPNSLRTYVKDTIAGAFKPFNLELDFSGDKGVRDLVVEFSGEIPIWSAFGESARPTDNHDLERGESTVYVGLMNAVRLQTGGDKCEVAFPPTTGALGTMIANTAVHETAHMLGLDVGGYDGGATSLIRPTIYGRQSQQGDLAPVWGNSSGTPFGRGTRWFRS